MTPIELATGSIVGLIALNPTNIAVYLPLLICSVVGLIYGDE